MLVQKQQKRIAVRVNGGPLIRGKSHVSAINFYLERIIAFRCPVAAAP